MNEYLAGCKLEKMQAVYLKDGMLYPCAPTPEQEKELASAPGAMNREGAIKKMEEIREWVMAEQRSCGDVYGKMHELFDEKNPIEYGFFKNLCTGHELFLYEH
jgi:hypothetical protein